MRKQPKNKKLVDETKTLKYSNPTYVGFFMFAQRSWQTRPLERKWSHPD